jgi:hypothetical protein
MNKKKPVWKNVLGVGSHLLTFMVVFLVTSIIWKDSFVFGIIYLLIFLSWYLTIFWAYCSKCPCHFNCTHVYMGWMASKIYKTKRMNGSSTDYLINTVFMILGIIMMFKKIKGL